MAGLLVREDLAKLVGKDPDTRRSAMDSLKGYVDGELDEKSLPFFLEQLAAESTQGDACAMSLVVEVARVHGPLIVPHIPRIMTSVVRSLPFSAGAHNLLQACAKVVSSLACYAIDSPALGADAQCEILGSLCHPLLAVLCSKVEPVAVGAAACLRALVETEVWKFAAPDLVKVVFYRAAMALGEKGTQTVAHMHLVRTLAKLHPWALQDCGAALLDAGADILLATRGSWQQRAAAAQLLGALLSVVDQRTLALQFATTSEALERSRLDKVTVVRSAVGEALNFAKSLSPSIHHLLQNNCFQESPSLSPKPPEHRNRGRRRSLRSREDASRITKNRLACSQELQVVPDNSLARLESSESKEIAPLMGKPVEPALSRSLDGSIQRVKSAKGVEEDNCPMEAMDDSFNDTGNNSYHLYLEEERRETSQARLINRYLQSADMSSYRNGSAQTEFQTTTTDEWEAFLTSGNDREDSTGHHVSSKLPESWTSAEDFVLFATPRRLVSSLQSMSSTLESGCTPEEGLERDFETVSESAWSVRDNPMATDSDEDSHRKSTFSEFACNGDSILDCAKDFTVSQARVLSFSGNDVSLSALAESSDLLLEAPSRCHQLCDVDICMPKLGGANELKLAGQQYPADQRMSMECDATGHSTSQIAQKDASEGEDKWLSRQQREMSVGGWTILDRRLSKIQCYIEMFLGGALCAVVLFPMVIAIINCCSRQQNIHTLLPT